ncbi:MAG: acetate kinase [Candidatus Eisenbacteria bacterium RBG_16_71_46]|nr:MAG: acetate kinase [Candidatus Eisenbacteria bacterium RBG_16_71_46]
MKVLVLNCGSSSVKYQLIETTLEAIAANADRALAQGIVERIGSESASHTYRPEGRPRISAVSEILEHGAAIAEILRTLTDPASGVVEHSGAIEAVGHRVVHGGEAFARSVFMTPEVVRQIEECIELAPLHNPHNLRGFLAAKEILPGVPHVAVFDTAFHQTMPPHAFLYGLPYVLYKRHGIRRYGFHGTSHRFVAWRSEALLGRPRAETRLITCHLGNGASVCAVDRGRSVDTSMGFTPLEGLLMGTRCGDLDPALIFYVMHKEDLSEHQATTLLNKHSGLFGISGVSNDMAELLAEEAKGHERARLAVDLFCYRLRKYVAAYAGAMGGADAVILTGGIGENAAAVRERALTGLEFMGVRLDPGRNRDTVGREGEISAPGSPVNVLVIPTNEELLIARDTLRLVAAGAAAAT